MELIKINKIIIHSPGDESVGIFSDTWTIEPEVYIEPEDLEIYRESLRATWEHVADDAKVYFEYDDKSEFEFGIS
jgi:hypothetical protein